MRIVLDSTILIQANTAAPSSALARDLLLTLLGQKHTLIVSNPILFEVAKVLRYPRLQIRHALTETGIYQYIAFLREAGEVVDVDLMIPVPIRDTNDIMVCQTAILGEADFLCTTDKDFFEAVTSRFLLSFGVTVTSAIDLIHALRTQRP